MSASFDCGNVLVWMTVHCKEHVDPRTGEVNSTALAEAAADAFGQKDEGGPLDDETHWIWDLAARF